jgi:hypothetical protein
MVRRYEHVTNQSHIQHIVTHIYIYIYIYTHIHSVQHA